MELKFETRSCRCLRGVDREVRNLEQTQELRLPDGMPDIGRVLAAWGQVLLRSKEWRSDGMTASGGVMVWVLYAAEDGGSPQWVDGWIPFQGKWNFPETERDGIVRMIPLLRSVDARTVSARKMMLRVSVGILGEALEPMDVQICVPGDFSEGIQVLRNTYPTQILKEAGEKTFLLDEEYALSGSGDMPPKLLRFQLIPQLADWKVMTDKLVFRGCCLLRLLYQDQAGELCNRDLEIPFSQFADLDEEFGQDADAVIDLAVTSVETDLTEDGNLRIKCGLVAQYMVLDKVFLEIGEDAYAIGRDVMPSFQELRVPAILERRKETVSAEISLEGGCGRVLDACFLPDHPGVSRMGETITGELSGLWQLLYEDENGVVQTAIRRWEQNMNMDAAADANLSFTVEVSGSPVVSVNGGRITAKSNIALDIRTESERGQLAVCALNIGEEKRPDPNRPSVILRRTEGERLWDLAKNCGTTVSAICQANGLTGEPEIGEMLLIPVQ